MTSYRLTDKDTLPRLPRGGLSSAPPRAGLQTLDDSGLVYDIGNERPFLARSTPPASLYRTAADRPASPGASGQTWRLMQEMQEQLKLYKKELEKKDDLITSLATGSKGPETPKINGYFSSGDPAYPPQPPAQPPPTGARTLHYRMAAESATGELAAMQVKAERLQAELGETKNRCAIKDVQIRDMETEIQSYKEDNARQVALVQTLRNRIREMEDETGTLSVVKGRGEITIQALQKEMREYQDRVAELEGRLRSHISEREDAEQKSQSWERKYRDLCTEVGRCISLDTAAGSIPDVIEKVTHKINTILEENTMLRGRLSTLTEALNSSELETKASRETIMRLVSEVGREQRNLSQINTSTEQLRMDREEAIRSKEALVRENQLLRERIESSEKAWKSTRDELEHREGRVQTMDEQLRTSQYTAKAAQTQLDTFKQAIASLLSDGHVIIHEREDDIKDRIRSIMGSSRDKQAEAEMLDLKVKELTKQLESQCELHQQAIRRAKKAEAGVGDLKDRLNNMEGELSSADVLRDGLRTDKQRYLEFLEKMARVMKLDEIALDVGFDLNGDALVARAQQLVHMEGDSLKDRTTHVYNLQRKVKQQKEQLESKDLHMDLLRKKIGQLEEKLQGRNELALERDDAAMKIRKLQKQVERLQGQLGNARHQNTELKAKLQEVTDLKVRTLQQKDHIKEQEDELLRLRLMKEKLGKKVSNLKSEIQMTEAESEETKVLSSNTVQALSNELRSTKLALDEVARREKELVDFRQVIARMLGLEIHTLAVPNYEIIARLEKLVNAHHAHTATTLGVETALDDNFVAGYEDARRFLKTSPRSPRRARSVSPARRYYQTQ
ncbi:coiled-coil domain-containing protein 170-like isoform X2 [Branchiostoma floridae]|uniref:Coiled-coil domain-containing protein 170-like isoform X2 n=1 Tax=Branchiostoma floridae TaxID=7739 RepID=A0A9J7LEB5_BRAFL|nr:coiled-coil domain-containing protein 170-like isoform X2 [Branchiostoma floridae]